MSWEAIAPPALAPYAGAFGAALFVLFVVRRWLSPPAKNGSDAKGKADSASTKPAREETKTKAAAAKSAVPEVPRIAYDDADGDSEEETTTTGESPLGARASVVYDEDAAIDEPTREQPLLALSSAAHTDKGLRRKRNEDSILALDAHGLFAVADGMGGAHGGELASSLAVETLRGAFESSRFEGDAPADVPARAANLVRAMMMANRAVRERARDQRELKGMGTTMVAAWFAARKQRLYLGHVGDSRVYRLRDGRITQLTKDHTMEELGIGGDAAKNLSRALGIWSRVPIDVFVAKPHVGDLYLLCSDGLTKMVDEERITKVMLGADSLQESARALVDAANASGGKDNVSVVVVRVEEPTPLAAAGA